MHFLRKLIRPASAKLLRPFARLAIVATLFSVARPTEAAPSLVLQFTDGSTAQGEVDSLTDEQKLWLRREEAGIQLRSGYPWSRISGAQHEGRFVVGREFRELAQELATPGKPGRQVAPFPPVPGDAQAVVPASFVAAGTRRPRLVQSLRIEAYLGQWSDDARNDGLWVAIYPLSRDGELVPVDGNLDLTLLGEVEPTLIGRAGPPEFRELSRSYEMVRSRDFARGAAIYQLPFRMVHPDLHFDIATAALVHARLGVPGQGVFEASFADVPLRDCSRIRDQLQLHTRQRFFPAENVSPRLP